MPSFMMGKNQSPIIRQLSLQNQLPHHPSKHFKLKKQFSEDDSRELSAVEITGQAWPAIERTDSTNRLDLAEEKTKQTKMRSGRLKPTKMAWTDKKQETFDCLLEVEVVATKCREQIRPLSIKAQRFQTPLIGNKDTLAYTRVQLAERLRNAWSEREKIKPNLNIFLAHTAGTTRNDNSSSDRQDNASTLSDTTERKVRLFQMRAFSQDYCPPNLLRDKSKTPPLEVEKKENKNEGADKNTTEASATNLTSNNDSEHPRELNKIEVKVLKPENDCSENEENLEFQDEESKEKDLLVKSVQPSPKTAKERRNCYRSSSALHKTITESFSLPGKEEISSEGVTEPGKKPVQKKVLVRAFSAPSHDQICSKEISSQKIKVIPRKRLQSTASFDTPDTSPKDDVNASWDRIKSAPIRRKLKSAAARRKNKDKGDSSSEDEAKETASKKTTKRGKPKSGSDIITMVSLVSPAESDTEDSMINLPLEAISPDNEEVEVTTQAKTPGQESVKGVLQEMQKFISLRKTPKTVTFQTNPILSKNYSSSFPSRRAPAGTPIIIPPPVISNPALTPAQLQERDKRPPPIFARSDGKGIKRRLIRSSSEPVKGDEAADDKSIALEASSLYANEYEGLSSDPIEKSKIEEPEEDHPPFKCPKEKECWTLYKKMIATGISVTFDTVLRGMLTPTEYRLKKNRLLSTC